MKISIWKAVSCVCAVVALTTMAVVAKDVRTISIRDECDPATFNEAVGEGTCVGDGEVTFAEFLDALADGGHEKWEFNNDRTETDLAVNSSNRGGEAHTFTEVRQFGGGFIPLLNMGQAPAPECVLRDANGNPIPDGAGGFVPGAAALASLVPPGGTSATKTLSRGTHRFMCCIHPWMQSTVTRR
jgi:hypothetical protein